MGAVPSVGNEASEQVRQWNWFKGAYIFMWVETDNKLKKPKLVCSTKKEL